MPSGTLARLLGFVAFALFLWCAPATNWMFGHVGTHCPAGGPCVLPVAPGLEAHSGVVVVGVALVLRNLVQRFLGIAPSFIAILGGALVTVVIAPPELLVATTAAVLIGELTGLAVFTRLQRRGLVAAVIASSLAGVAVDSVVFLDMAFGSLDQLPATAMGKVWGVLACLPVVYVLRRVAPAPLA